jgi:hypothetical protein
MPSSTLRHGSFSWGTRLAALWAGMLAGPLTWAALLETNYVLSYVACEQRGAWMLHLATGIALAVIGAGAYIAWMAAPPLGARNVPSTVPADAAVARARFMAITALGLCAWFALVVIATEIPALVLHPCTP